MKIQWTLLIYIEQINEDEFDKNDREEKYGPCLNIGKKQQQVKYFIF